MKDYETNKIDNFDGSLKNNNIFNRTQNNRKSVSK